MSTHVGYGSNAVPITWTRVRHFDIDEGRLPRAMEKDAQVYQRFNEIHRSYINLTLLKVHQSNSIDHIMI